MAKGFNSSRSMGLGGGINMSMVKQAQKMQQDMMKMQEELKTREYSAAAGGGMVTAKVNGKRELLEECGCTAKEFTYLGKHFPTPAYDSEII